MKNDDFEIINYVFINVFLMKGEDVGFFMKNDDFENGNGIVGDEIKYLIFLDEIVFVMKNNDFESRYGIVIVNDENRDFDVFKMFFLMEFFGCLIIIDGLVVENGEGQVELEFKKGFELRERRRSKYLLFFYVNISKGLKGLFILKEFEIENFIVFGSEEGSVCMFNLYFLFFLVLKSGSKKKEKKWFRKFVFVFVNFQEISVFLIELLLELYVVVLDCQYFYKNKNFDFIEMFFIKFRVFLYYGEYTSFRSKKGLGNEVGKLYINFDFVVGMFDGNQNKFELEMKKIKEKIVMGFNINIFFFIGFYNVNINFVEKCFFLMVMGIELMEIVKF